MPRGGAPTVVPARLSAVAQDGQRVHRRRLRGGCGVRVGALAGAGALTVVAPWPGPRVPRPTRRGGHHEALGHGGPSSSPGLRVRALKRRRGRGRGQGGEGGAGPRGAGPDGLHPRGQWTLSAWDPGRRGGGARGRAGGAAWSAEPGAGTAESHRAVGRGCAHLRRAPLRAPRRRNLVLEASTVPSEERSWGGLLAKPWRPHPRHQGSGRQGWSTERQARDAGGPALVWGVWPP